MEEALRVTLVANAGVLLEYDGTTLLLDGIYGPEGHPFSNLAPRVWQAMLAGEPPFERIDYLLFTHAHPDHFSPAMTLEYLRRRPVKGVFAPDTRTVGESGLRAYLQESGTPCVLLSEETDRAAFRIEPRLTVRAFRTAHLDKAFARVKHFCYLISFGEKQVLFTADINYVTEDLARLRGRELRAAFVNPMFFNALRTGKFFKGTLPAAGICVYHVPFSEDDSTGIRQRLEHDLACWDAGRGPVVPLWDRFQQIEL